MTDEALANFSIYDPAVQADVHSILRRARQTCPVARSESSGGFWLISRYEDVRRVALDPETFSSERDGENRAGTSRADIPDDEVVPMPPMDIDPPLQSEFRRLLNRHFSPSAVARHRPAMVMIANNIIDEWIDDSEVEFVERFSLPFTMTVLSHLVFDQYDPAEIYNAQRVVEHIATTGGNLDDWHGLQRYAQLAIDRRRSLPEQRDDVMGAIISGSVDRRPLTAREQVGVVMILLLGGLDTTKGAITGIIQALASNPVLEDRMTGQSWVRGDLDEFIRMISPVCASARVATHDTQIAGQPVRRGDSVLLSWMSANRDESVFGAEEGLNFARDRNPHVGFGIGIHRCLGSNLARLQIEVAIQTLLSRITSIRRRSAEPVAYVPGVARQPGHLWLSFQRR